MCGVKADIRNRGQATAVQQNRYVLRKDDKDWVKKYTTNEAEGVEQRERRRKTWK